MLHGSCNLLEGKCAIVLRPEKTKIFNCEMAQGFLDRRSVIVKDSL